MFTTFIYLFLFSLDGFVCVCPCLDVVSHRINATAKQIRNGNVDGTMHKGPTSHSTLFLLFDRSRKCFFPRHSLILPVSCGAKRKNTFPFYAIVVAVPHIQLLSHLTNYTELYVVVCARCARLSGFVCLFPMETHVLQK